MHFESEFHKIIKITVYDFLKYVHVQFVLIFLLDVEVYFVQSNFVGVVSRLSLSE